MCRDFRMCPNFNQQLKIDCGVHGKLYMNLTVITNKKHRTDTQKINRKKSNITLKRVIRSQKKSAEEERNTEEQNKQTNTRKWNQRGRWGGVGSVEPMRSGTHVWSPCRGNGSLDPWEEGNSTHRSFLTGAFEGAFSPARERRTWAAAPQTPRQPGSLLASSIDTVYNGHDAVSQSLGQPFVSHPLDFPPRGADRTWVSEVLKTELSWVAA